MLKETILKVLWKKLEQNLYIEIDDESYLLKDGVIITQNVNEKKSP